MLHLLYILTFTVLAFLAIGNLIRSLLTLGLESQRLSSSRWSSTHPGEPHFGNRRSPAPHPELLDTTTGQVIDEPLLVMRSLSAEDIRDRLDALYDSSPSSSNDTSSESS